MISLAGKAALITGGSRGIGAAAVKLFAQAGADVIFSYNKAKDAAAQVEQEAKKHGTRVEAFKADAGRHLDNKKLVDQCVARLGRLDIVVANVSSISKLPSTRSSARPQPVGNLAAYLKEVHQIAGTGWALNLEVVAVVEVVGHQGANQQHIDGHPDGPAPIGVAPEHAGVRFGGKIIHAVFLAFHVDDKRMFVMVFGERPYPMRTQEFVLIEHPREYPAKPLLVHERHYAAFPYPKWPGPVAMEARSQLGHAPQALSQGR